MLGERVYFRRFPTLHLGCSCERVENCAGIFAFIFDARGPTRVVEDRSQNHLPLKRLRKKSDLCTEHPVAAPDSFPAQRALPLVHCCRESPTLLGEPSASGIMP